MNVWEDIMSTKTTHKARTSNDTATREEQTAVSTLTDAAVHTFVTNAATSNGLTFSEARDYVAAVDAHGKRGGAAAVQRAIADAVSAAGYEPLSQSRYSKLADAYRAIGAVGIECDADAFRVFYGLWNVSSALLTAATRSEIVETAKRKRADNRLPFLASELDAARAGKRRPVADADDSEGSTGAADETTDALKFERNADGVIVATADAVLDALAELFAAAEQMTDADRIRVADAFRANADALVSAVVPTDAAALAAA